MIDKMALETLAFAYQPIEKISFFD